LFLFATALDVKFPLMGWFGFSACFLAWLVAFSSSVRIIRSTQIDRSALPSANQGQREKITLDRFCRRLEKIIPTVKETLFWIG
jgi:hypothetical protein